ncbi:MAG: isoprenylcysteine carboxylmethyltransferase family protein [Ignavibacterium sp.]|nr:isoprenylcysteine carboxylmethyltransferase family protein [Ignavibacterium sp.]MDW8375145.1 isoprenylcysteine carboxylmethyltransferase family protein [Ignavibacteriales bacterium]
MLKDILLTVLLISLFGISHSILASLWVKQKLKNILKEKIAFYRLSYNLISILSLIIILYFLPEDNRIIYRIQKPYSYLMLIPFLFGIYGVYISSKYFSVKEFLGISQIERYFNKNYSSDELDERLTLRIDGPYRFSRHPIYFFSIIILLSIPVMTVSRLTLVICFIIYFYIGSIYEEKKLVKIFGQQYINYQKEVPRIFPKIKIHL